MSPLEMVAKALEIAEARFAEHRMRGTIYVPASHLFIYVTELPSGRVSWFIVPVN